VQRVEIIERETPVFGGAEYRAVGSYERLHGTVFGELDPMHPYYVIQRRVQRWLKFHGF
jgi:hypothetical protein